MESSYKYVNSTTYPTQVAIIAASCRICLEFETTIAREVSETQLAKTTSQLEVGVGCSSLASNLVVAGG